MNMYVCMCMEICPNKKLGFGVIQILGALFIGTPNISTHARAFVRVGACRRTCARLTCRQINVKHKMFRYN